MSGFIGWKLTGIAGIGFGGVILAAMPAWSAEVELGTSRDAVVQQMGEPEGRVMMGDTEVLFFPRGQVDLREGQVVRSSVLSEAEYQSEQQRLAEAAEARRKAAEEAAARRTKEGRSKLQEVKDRDTLAGQSASQRLAYWKKFQSQYPEVDVSAEIGSAGAEVQEKAETKAAFERKVAEKLDEPPPGLSRSKRRRYQRGRSESALAEREAEIRKQLKQEVGSAP